MTTTNSGNPIVVESREDLLDLLGEAAEIEHNLMCCYLYAAFGLKRTEADGLRHEHVPVLARFRAAIMRIAIEEMTHLALVANLTCAVGGRPHFNRQNFPVAPGYHPADVVIRLTRFDMATLEHFIFLERPRDSTATDSAPFAAQHDFKREAGVERGVMPTAGDYDTVGALYEGIRTGLGKLARTLGERELFVGSPLHQVGSDVASLPGLRTVTDLATACAAIDTVIEQGEGAPEHRDNSHYERFRGVKSEYEAILVGDPDFQPSLPVAENPVMRRPADPDADRVFIDSAPAAAALDLANALYTQMLRVLVQAYGRAAPEPADQKALLAAATDTMGCMIPLGEALARLPASTSSPGVNAGMSFATLRSLAPAIEGAQEWELLAERFNELSGAAGDLTGLIPALESLPARLTQIADDLLAHSAKVPTVPSGTSSPPAYTAACVTQTLEPGARDVSAELFEGRDIEIVADMRRCIHSRFCVLWRPEVFEANAPGPWIHPGAAHAEAIAAVIANCPSGALSYRRLDGGPDEAAPPVNLAYLRQNGPVAIRGDLRMDGEPLGYRRTFCRCGASTNKPFCDNSHKEIGFSADAEPPTGGASPLQAPDGPILVEPQRNGPLRVSGNLEIVSGTGRTVSRSVQVRLCRCGHSQDKPFCDGNHARVGFRSVAEVPSDVRLVEARPNDAVANA